MTRAKSIKKGNTSWSCMFKETLSAEISELFVESNHVGNDPEGA